MIHSNINKERIRVTNHFCIQVKERSYLFSPKDRLKEIFDECLENMLDNKKSVWVEDERDTQSNYICIFKSSNGSIVAIPCFFQEPKTFVLTIKDVKNDERNPNWFIKKYNDIAITRGLEKLNSIGFNNH